MESLINDGHPFLTADERTAGMSQRQVSAAVSRGVLRRIYRGCVVDNRVPDTRRLRVEALDLVKPRHGVACNETAAFLYGIDAYKPSERFELRPSFVVPHAMTRIEHSNVRCRQALIDHEDIVEVDGIVATSPVRTTSDLLRGLYRPYALAAADAFARSGLIEREELVDYVGRLKGYRWIVQARGLAVLVDGRAESPGESWQRLRIHDAGLPPPEPQLEVTMPAGSVRRLDLAYPELLIGSEYDGTAFHTSLDDVAHDVERRRVLTEIYGWRWVIGTRARIFGPDPAFEVELGELLGIPPLLPRRWGTR
jgi:hypothetical protein